MNNVSENHTVNNQPLLNLSYSDLIASGIPITQFSKATGIKNAADWKKKGIPKKFQSIIKSVIEGSRRNPEITDHLIYSLSKSEGGYKNTVLTSWDTDFQSLVNTFSTPAIGSKDGAYFIRCFGTQRNNTDTSDKAVILILDGDSRINEDGEIIPGAPDPELAHQVLTRLNIAHCIYSSHSNGATYEELTAKGIDSGGMYGADYHKYRVIILCTYSPKRLPILLEYLFSELHKAGVMLASVKENKAWSQPWYFPRVPDEQRKVSFKFYHHDGNAMDVESIHQDWLINQPKPEQLKYKKYKPQPGENITGWRNPIKEFNRSYSLHDVLIRNGYIKKGLKKTKNKTG